MVEQPAQNDTFDYIMNLPINDPIHIEMLRKLSTLTPEEVTTLTYAAGPARDAVLAKLGEPPIQQTLLRMLEAARAAGEQVYEEQQKAKPSRATPGEVLRFLLDNERPKVVRCVAALQSELDTIKSYHASPHGLRSHNLDHLIGAAQEAKRYLLRIEAWEELKPATLP